MKTCPKCGAENRQTAAECRLCATRLESPADLLAPRMDAPFPEALPETTAVPHSGGPKQPETTPASRLHISCPICKADNEADWSFCQQCGSRLLGRDPQGEFPFPAGQNAAPGNAEGARPPSPPTSPERAQPDWLIAEPNKGPAAVNPPQQPSGVPPAGKEPSPSGRIGCPECGAMVPPGGTYCASCGRSLSAERRAGIMAATEEALIQIITDGGQAGNSYPVGSNGIHVGRIEGDLTFPHDGYMSGKHAKIVEQGGRYFLIDEDSRNGTFIRIHGGVELKPGDTFLVGKQVFRFIKK